MTDKVFKVKHGLDVKSGTIARNGTIIVDTDGKISWSTLKGLPSDFTPSDHTHSNYLDQAAVDARITSVLDLGSTPDQLNTLKEIADELAGTNAYVTLIDQITQKADAIHTHDDRYYTETESDNLLSNKVSTTTLTSNYYNKTNTYSKTEVDANFSGVTHTHPLNNLFSSINNISSNLITTLEATRNYIMIGPIITVSNDAEWIVNGSGELRIVDL